MLSLCIVIIWIVILLLFQLNDVGTILPMRKVRIQWLKNMSKVTQWWSWDLNLRDTHDSLTPSLRARKHYMLFQNQASSSVPRNPGPMVTSCLTTSWEWTPIYPIYSREPTIFMIRLLYAQPALRVYLIFASLCYCFSLSTAFCFSVMCVSYSCSSGEHVIV